MTTPAFLSLASLVGIPADAQDSSQPRVDLHGFGDWVYGKTNGNQYLAGDHAGNYEDASLALNLVATASDRLSVVAEWVDGPNGSEVQLDYSFAEWKLSDRLRLGQQLSHHLLQARIVVEIRSRRPLTQAPRARRVAS